MSKESSKDDSNNVMKKIIEASKGETIDLVVEHILPGVTPEMIDWWWPNITKERYKLWHPNDHKSFEWEYIAKEGMYGSIHKAVETLGVETTLRIRSEDPSTSPIPIEYDHAAVGSTLDANNNSMTWVCHEYNAIENGTQLRSTFRLPSKVPKPFIELLRKHCKEEIGEFVNFLPRLYEQNKNSD